MIGGIIGGRYRIERLLGEGGMGSVYEALHTSTARRVALKLITKQNASNDLVKRFGVEAKAAGLIDSEHVAQVLDMGIDEERGIPFLALELLSGEDLRALAKRLGVLPPPLALRIVGQALRGLSKAHARGILHRDIKPGNLFLAEREGGRRIVKVLDFGIAKIRGDHALVELDDQNITATGAMLGTPRYMSPEQTKGLKRTDERTDLWALGVVLYELLSGQPPHPDAEGVGDLIVRLCTEPSHVRDVAPWVPKAVATVVDKALAIDAKERWQTCGEMLAAIQDLVPDGLDIPEDMLVPLRDRDGGDADPPRASSASSGRAILVSSSTTVTSASTRSTAPAEAAPKRRAPKLLGGVLGAAALGLTAFLLLGGSEPSGATSNAAAQPAPSSSAVVPAAAAVPAATAPPAASSSASNGELLRAKVAIVPIDASVELDGVAAPSEGGVVEIVGKPGSVHRVRVFKGRLETSADVSLTEQGALPAKVALATPTSKGRPAPARVDNFDE